MTYVVCSYVSRAECECAWQQQKKNRNSGSHTSDTTTMVSLLLDAGLVPATVHCQRQTWRWMSLGFVQKDAAGIRKCNRQCQRLRYCRESYAFACVEVSALRRSGKQSKIGSYYVMNMWNCVCEAVVGLVCMFVMRVPSPPRMQKYSLAVPWRHHDVVNVP